MGWADGDDGLDEDTDGTDADDGLGWTDADTAFLLLDLAAEAGARGDADGARRLATYARQIQASLGSRAQSAWKAW